MNIEIVFVEWGRTMSYTMVVEQTKAYPKRMIYIPETKSFQKSAYDSLFYVRKFDYPYGWMKESGTPPSPHWDVLLMSDRDFELGDEVKIRVIGVFMRKDGDHKYIAIEDARDIQDFAQLSQKEKEDLKRLYPRINEGEGWFGKEVAERAMAECEKAL